MKFSESWLREWVNPAIDTGTLVAQLTMAGLEVDGVEPVAGKFSSVIVGEIVAVTPHPNADKLRVCQVTDGGDSPVQVVCGAANAREGLKVPFAQVGATLPGGLKIRKAKLRDVESFGMLCGKEELGLEEKSDGLWELPTDAPLGVSIVDFAGLADSAIEIDLTPNRGDCLGIRGLAREVGVLNDAGVNPPNMAAVPAAIEDSLPIVLAAGEKCPRYCGRVIRNIDNGKQTPLWMTEKLRRSGLRSIDAVVDITNFVLLELGQPMHAFDLSTLSPDGISVRTARKGETLRLLDDSTAELQDGTLLITSDDNPIAMAGIMGGKATSVSAGTRDIFLESAFFQPLAIVGEARKYGLHTDSSHRFERGVDPALASQAIERATQLLLDIVGGRPGPVICREIPELLPQPAQIFLYRKRLAQQLAMDIDPVIIENILTRLGLELVFSDDNGWRLSVPSWRFDLAIEADLIEEIARVYGYNRLPLNTPVAPMLLEPDNETNLPPTLFASALVERGYREAITYSFVDPAVQALITPDMDAIPVANPISTDLAVMRTSLWPGLLTALTKNINRQQNRVRLFETGLRFLPSTPEKADITQEKVIAGVVCGSTFAEGWTHSDAGVDFYDLKGDVEALLALTADTGNFEFSVAVHPALHPGRAARISRNGQPLGHLGQLHPAVQKQLDISKPVFMFELQLEPLAVSRLPTFRELSRFPSIRKDIAIIVNEEITAEDIFSTIRRQTGGYLVDLKVFDVYQGKGIENNRKSIGLGLTFQHDSRTLIDNEIFAEINKYVDCLSKEFGAELRGELK